MTNEILRYPIGQFRLSDDITLAQRIEAIAAISDLPERLRAAVHGLTDAQLDTPYRDGAWTLRQVVHHVADSHMNAYVRFKLALTEEAPTIKPYDEKRWAELFDARTLPVDVSLGLLEMLHARWVVLLRSMRETDFARAFSHPEHPGLIPLDKQTGLYGWHGQHHTAIIVRFREQRGWGMSR